MALASISDVISSWIPYTNRVRLEHRYNYRNTIEKIQEWAFGASLHA